MIFAASNIFVGSLCLLLPETKHSSLPTTIKEAEDLQKYISQYLKQTQSKRFLFTSH